MREVIVSDGTPIALPPGIRRLKVDLPSRRRRGAGSTAEECVAFAAYREIGDSIELLKPEDPMAEQVLVPGDPESMSRASERTARWYEIVSGILITLNIVVNVPIIFLLLSLLIR